MTVTPSLAELLSASGDAAYEWNRSSDHIKWFGAWDKLFGREVIPPMNSKSFEDVVHPDDRHLVFGSNDHSTNRHYRLRTSHDAYVWVHECGSSSVEEGRVVRQRGLLRISADHHDAELHHASQDRDALTGCLSRDHMASQITKAIQAAQASRRMSAYLVIGINKMSFVNDAVGMDTGNALLRGVAERLTQMIPTRAVLARVGGDMFGVLLPEPLGGDFRMLAERLLQSFRDHPVVASTTPLHITVSIGGISLPATAKSADEVMIFAEQALHDANRRGLNVFAEYTDKPERAQENRQFLELVERIKYAFKNDGFRLAYQPVVQTSTGQAVFYEALVRMFAEDGKPISAALFVPAIEQLGLAYELDCRVLDLAVRELESNPELCLAVNVSGLTASTANWPDHVDSVLKSRPSVAARVIFEITETAALVDIEKTRHFSERARALGASISLDDFGAGSTSIRHLRSLPLSIMKIDKDLLTNVTTNPEQQHLVLILIELARGLGLRTVAEGIETEDMADWLRRAKVDMMQGYYFGKPSLERPDTTNKSEKATPAKAALAFRVVSSNANTPVTVRAS